MADPDPRLAAVARVRELVHSISAHTADDALLGRIAAAAEELVAELRTAPQRERNMPRFGELEVITPDPTRRHPMDDRGVAGIANPSAVDFVSRREGDDAIADVTFGPAFEGAPGRVHGGMVAAVFDDLVGFVLALVGEPGFTGRLTVEYRAPVPTETTVEFRARLRERDGRKLHVEADARLDDKILAVAEATMILVAPDHWSKHAQELLQ